MGWESVVGERHVGCGIGRRGRNIAGREGRHRLDWVSKVTKVTKVSEVCEYAAAEEMYAERRAMARFGTEHQVWRGRSLDWGE